MKASKSDWSPQLSKPNPDDVIAKYQKLLATMSPKDKSELDAAFKSQLQAVWLPDPRNIPQCAAYVSKADLLLYGGAAGGGKSDLLCGMALTHANNSVIFRAQYKDLRDIEARILKLAGSRDGYNGADMVLRKGGKVVELGALGKPGQEQDWQGRPHDFIGFDEGAQLSVDKIRFVLTWLRGPPGVRTRAIIASNPPMGGEGEWMTQWFAPWLDPIFPNPAAIGELRWAVVDPEGHTIWVDGPEPYSLGGEMLLPKTRTFIPARLEDNPYVDPSYRAQLQQLPEPMRSKLLRGDFLAGRTDHAWQIIPSEWVRLAQARWHPRSPENVNMLTMGVDPGGGGPDPHAVATCYGVWFDQVETIRGIDSKNGNEFAGQIISRRKNEALIGIDMTGGWGNSVRDHLATNKIPVETIIFNAKSGERDKSGKMSYGNLRAQLYWQFREALDPTSDEKPSLPPDEQLFAQLTAVRWKPKGEAIWAEEKADVRARLGSSTDKGDAVLIAWHLRHRAMRQMSGTKDDISETVEPEDPLAAV